MRFKVNDKVVPIKKSFGCKLSSSKHIERADKIGQKFLYVVMVVKDEYKCDYILSHKPYEVVGKHGDMYMEGDFIKYKEVVNK